MRSCLVRRRGWVLAMLVLAGLLTGCTNDPLRPQPEEEQLAVAADGRGGVFAHWLTGWVGIKGWYRLPGEAGARSGIVRFARSALITDSKSTAFQVLRFQATDGAVLDSLPPGTTVHFRFLVTDTEHGPAGVVSDACEWTWTDGVLRRVE